MQLNKALTKIIANNQADMAGLKRWQESGFDVESLQSTEKRQDKTHGKAQTVVSFADDVTLTQHVQLEDL